MSAERPKEMLDTMLGYLGFVVDVEVTGRDDGQLLQVHTNEAEKLIGRRGETMGHMQYLLNRLLQAENREAPKVQVDIAHYRQMRDDELVQQVRRIAENVIESGKAIQLEPMNAYQRRVIHQAFKDDPHVQTVSPHDDARIKRITVKPR